MDRDAKFAHDDDHVFSTTLASNHNAVTIFIAVGQLLFAIATLYRSRGNQIVRYGYAAFGLTVTPYAVMSFVNLLGNLFCHQHPALYLVESKDSREARSMPETVIDGCIGELIEDSGDDTARDHFFRDVQTFPTALLNLSKGENKERRGFDFF